MVERERRNMHARTHTIEKNADETVVATLDNGQKKMNIVAKETKIEIIFTAGNGKNVERRNRSNAERGKSNRDDEVEETETRRFSFSFFLKKNIT